MANCVQPNTVVKIENESFSVLAWHGLLQVWSRWYSHPAVRHEV